jgi:hypothetical protein
MKHKGLKCQGSLYVLAVLCVIAAGLVVPRLWPQVVQACTQYTRVFGENFDTINFKDVQNSSVTQWMTPENNPVPGPIILPRLGSNFAVASPGGMGAYIYVCGAGDFTGDGYPDLIGLDISRQRLGQTNPMSKLVLIRNRYVTSPTSPFLVDPATAYENFQTNTGPASITVADYNGDGLLDFLFMRNSADEFGYTDFLAAMYINTGTRWNPVFAPSNVSPNLNFTARFQTAGIYINWAADHLTSVDIDKDGDMDILAISQDKIFLIRNPGPVNFTVDQFEVGELAYDSRTGFTVGRGGSCVSAADFDNDGDVDVVGGTVNNIAYLVYYENDGLGHFTRKELAIPVASCTGSVGVLGRDFTNDGWPDIFVATDRWNAGNLAHIWFLRNHGLKDTVDNTVDPPITVTDIDWEFKCLNNCDPIIPPDYDVDMSTPLDYDNDGDLDIVIADANHSGDYYLIKNELAEIYELRGQAQSTNIAASVLDPHLHAITRVRVTSIRQGILKGSSTGLAVALYFSNNGGRDWELYRRFEAAAITNATNLPWYDFKQFGADLRWRAALTAAEDPMQEYTGASFETPYIDDLQLEFIYVDRREYSRASAAATIVTQGGINKKLVIGSSFIFPGWEGQLRSYDVSSVSFTGGAYSALQTITSSDLDAATGRTIVTGAEIFWDAGQMLQDRYYDDRRIYTAIRAGGTVTNPLTRVDFTRANVGNVATAGSLAWCLQDVNNDNAGLIDFVRGKDRYWKMGDINHSTPIVIGPPSEDPAYMGTGYAEFQQAYAGRPKVLYVGANDGMLHCFDTATGEELWGFIPYNLLRKLKNMYAVDAVNNIRYFAHDVYVDGTPSAADVQINGAWRTVLVTGQGPGSGSVLAGGLNYYWALDVTDPANPLPLWEIMHKDGSNRITMGETWSTPAIGKVNHSGTARWVAFMGSGYDNDPAADIAGRYFYVVRLDTGAIIRTQSVANVNTAALSGARQPYRYTNIPVAIVASPTAVDTDSDGFVNSVYVGDLDGRLYRMDVTQANPTNWALTAIYTDYLYYPIITKPAVWVNPYVSGPVPRIYFGTGGDDRAPDSRDYSFVGLIDNGGNSVAVEWYLGIPAVLNLSSSYDVGDLGLGSKVWADPVIADDVVYFCTLRGSIENVNPCVNLGEAGRLYARYIRTTSAIPVGGTAFKSSEATPPEYLQLISKARRAVTVGEASRVAGRVNKREIYVHEYDSTLEMLEQPIGSLMRIKSWREIYRVI